MLLPLHSMMVVGWVAVLRLDTHRTLISLGAVGSWSGGWGSLASEWEVSGLLLCCLLLLLPNTPVGFELCACTYSASKLMPAVLSETVAVTARVVFSFF